MRFLSTVSYATVVYGAFNPWPHDSGAFRTNSSTGLLTLSLTALLGARQEETCPYPEPWVTCPDGEHCCPGEAPRCCESIGTCCPSSSQCCESGTCCPSSSTCYGEGLCCPHTAATCGKGFCLGKGQTCCGDSFCDSGIECLKSSGGSEVCCEADEIACDDDYCCPKGSFCVGDLLCESISETTSTSTSTRTSTSTSTRASFSTPTRISTKTTMVTSTSTPTTRTISPSSSACRPTSAAQRDLDSRSSKRQTADDPGDFLSVNGKCLPVMDFPCVEGLTDQLCASMCGGIQQQLAKGSPNVLSSTTMVLTWTGIRRADPACDNLHCPRQRDAENNTMQCDEFPFATTAEGGPGSHLMCISWKQNSGLQGPLIQKYRLFYNIQPGEQFVVRMGSCSSAGASNLELQNRGNDSPSVDTDANGQAVLSSGSTQWIADPRAGSAGAGFIALPLSNATAGAYNCTLSFASLDGLQSLVIVDGDGYTYWSQDAPATSETRNFAPSFSVNDTDDLVMVAAASRSISVSASIEATLMAQASSAAIPTALFKIAPGHVLKVLTSWGLVIGGLVIML